MKKTASGRKYRKINARNFAKAPRKAAVCWLKRFNVRFFAYHTYDQALVDTYVSAVKRAGL